MYSPKLQNVGRRNWRRLTQINGKLSGPEDLIVWKCPYCIQILHSAYQNLIVILDKQRTNVVKIYANLRDPKHLRQFWEDKLHWNHQTYLKFHGIKKNIHGSSIKAVIWTNEIELKFCCIYKSTNIQQGHPEDIMGKARSSVNGAEK